MPPPSPDPPPPDWDVISGSAAQWNSASTAAQKYGYDSTNQAIKDSSGHDNYLAVGVSGATTGHVAWWFTTVANANNCVCCLIPQATFNVIKGGTLNTQNGQISYNSHVYQLQLQTGTGTGSAIAFAYQVS